MNKDLEEQFNAFGITTKNANGTMKDGYTILEELSVKFKELGTVTDASSGELASLDNQMNALLEDIAGKYNINTLTAGLNSFDIAVNATETALNSAGSAQKEFTTALDSIDKKLEGIQGSFNELVTSGGLTTFIKLILDGTQALLDFANSGAGQFAIAVTMLTAGVLGLTAGVSKLTVALATLNINPVIASITALIVVGTATIALFDHLNVTLEENQQKLSEIQNEYNSAKSAVDNTETSLKNIRDRMSEINSINGISISEQNELDRLTLEEARLEGILAKEKERLRLASSELETQAEKTVYDTVENKYQVTGQTYTGYGDTVVALDTYAQTDRVQVLKDASAEMVKQADIVKNLNKLEEENGTLTELQTEQKQKAIKAYDEASAEALKYNDQLDKETYKLEENSETRKYAEEGMNAYTQALGVGNEVIEDNTDLQNENSEILATSEERQKELAENITDATKAYEEARDIVIGLKDSFADLNDVVDSYNSNNGWTLDSLNQLLELGSEYINLLDIENGTMSINEGKAQDLANARIDEAMAKAVAKAETELLAIAEGQAGDEAVIASAKILQAGKEVYESGLNALESSKGWQALIDTLKNNTGVDTNDEQAKIVLDNLKDTLYTYEGLRDKVGSYTSSVKSNTSAVKSQTNALEEQRDAQIDAIEVTIKALEKEKKAFENNIDSQIKALERKRDIEEKYWDNKIKALEKENEKIKAQYELNQLLENQANVSKTKVLSGGKWDYTTNEQESSDAQMALDSYYREQETQRQIDLLEKQREKALANYDKQIQDLEDFKEAELAKYDERIEQLEEQQELIKEQYEIQIAQMEETNGKIVASQQNLLNKEKSIYDQRLSNAKSFQEQLNAITGGNPTFGGSSFSNTLESITGGNPAFYASGTPSVPKNQVAMVGDDPNRREIVIGSKLNGIPLNLEKGSGVIPAKETRTLTSLFTNMARNANYSSVNNNSKANHISIGNINLPSVQNGNDFIEYITTNFETGMLQEAY